MIEESMISANICAADFMKKNYGYGVYRVHEEPEFLKIESLKNFFSLKGLSYSKELNSLNLINAFINHANKNQESKIFNILILQSLKRAKYSTQEIGHFGLQLEKYSHFTSPIRRYPDLITHRLIKNMINSSKKTFSKELLEENLENLSDLERRAGITEFGLFCEIENYFISGLIHVSDLSRDRYIYDNQANILKGKRTGKTYRIGQKINAQLVSIVPEDRKITLVPK